MKQILWKFKFLPVCRNVWDVELLSVLFIDGPGVEKTFGDVALYVRLKGHA